MRNPRKYNEQELLLQIAEGDEVAFTELFYAWHHKLGEHVFRITEDREMAGDIVQEVFIKIWMIRESLAEIQFFETWLYTISRNKTFNILKQVARRRSMLNNVEASMDAGQEGTRVSELQDMIDQAIANLPAQQRKVYLMSRQDGMRYAEIAGELGISHETVKYYMKLALASITTSIRQQAGLSALLVILFRL